MSYFGRLGHGEAWEKGFVYMLRHERPHDFPGLCGGEAFEEEFQVDLRFDLVGLGGLH